MIAVSIKFQKDDLKVDVAHADRQGGAILPELQLYCIISEGFPVHHYMHAVVWRVIYAINNCEPLKVHFPKTEEEYAKAAADFKSVSTGHAINNCVCVIDGYHMETIVPPKSMVDNVRSYNKPTPFYCCR